MRILLAWLAGLVTYPAVSWCVRFVVTVATLPAGAALPTPRPLPLLRLVRTVGGLACGFGGYLAAVWVLTRLGQSAPLLLGAALALVVGVVHGVGLRRLAGGPQAREELFSLIGEEVGLFAGLAWHLVP